MGRRNEDDERYYEQSEIDAWVVHVGGRLAGGDQAAVEQALEFLERDPYFFRSGYARERVARRLAHVRLTPTQAARARSIVLSSVDCERHCPQPGVGRLAGAVADNPLRRALRARLHAHDDAVAPRSLRTIVCVRKPGLTREDVATARTLVLKEAARGLWLTPSVERLARYLWPPEWEAELRSLLPYHGPDRAAAKRLVAEADRRRQRRPGS